MKRFIYITAAALMLCSCVDLLDKQPANKFDAGSFFARESDLKLYSNGLINTALPDATDMALGEDRYTDICATKASKEMYWGSYSAAKASNWSTSTWSFPRRVAYMLDNMPRCKESLTEEVYKHYEAVARFWRAWITMKRIKVFGDCYFIDKVLMPTDTLELYSPRQDREEIFHKVTEDLEFACKNCLASGAGINDNSRIYINKYVALAYASRIFLYEGTYRKYHSVNPSTGRAWNGRYESSEDLLKLAEKYSKELVESNAFHLFTDYRSLFISSAIQPTEVIWGRTYSNELSVKHGVSFKYCSSTSSLLYSPTKEYVRMFLKTDGTPAEEAISVTQEFTDRDKRLTASVLAPGRTMKKNDGSDPDFLPNWNWTCGGYQWIKWVQLEETPMSGDTKSYNSIPIMRYAEVLLNYAEAAEELGHMDKSLWEKTIGELRRRGGVESIYPGDGNYVADQWLRDYYTQDVMHPVALSDNMLEIRRERVTELGMEGQSRYDDLMRWCLGDLIERRYNHQGWRGIYITQAEAASGINWNGTTYTISKSKKTSETNYKISGTDDGAWSLSEGTYGYLIYNYKLKWDDKMYLQPIAQSALNVNPDLGQNNGWQWQ